MASVVSVISSSIASVVTVISSSIASVVTGATGASVEAESLSSLPHAAATSDSEATATSSLVVRLR